jgi:catechol 2,3-dioxygenase-like lactoylglutathione lyase family enzyme
MGIVGLHHLDLAVRDVERSRSFYLAVLGPLGAEEVYRFPTYRGTEEVVYLRLGPQGFGLRPADGGEHRYHEVGLEHLAVRVERREEVDETYARCRELGVRIHFPPGRTTTSPGTGPCSSGIPTGSASRCSTGRALRTSSRTGPPKA